MTKINQKPSSKSSITAATLITPFRYQQLKSKDVAIATALINGAKTNVEIYGKIEDEYSLAKAATYSKIDTDITLYGLTAKVLRREGKLIKVYAVNSEDEIDF